MKSFTGVKLEYYKDGTIDCETYYENGKKHRIGGPAEIKYYTYGTIWYETYYENGKRHRIGAPAEIKYYTWGTIYSETYYEDGKRHRIGGPAIVNGHSYIRQYIYYQDGKYCNPYGPTEFRLNPKNLIIYKDYFSRIKKSFNVKGPAIIKRDEMKWGIYEVIQIIDPTIF